jgi:hypothetical protein
MTKLTFAKETLRTLADADLRFVDGARAEGMMPTITTTRSNRSRGCIMGPTGADTAR